MTDYCPMLDKDAEDGSWPCVRLHAENEELRRELDQWHRLTAGIELPEYPITEFQPKDLERENAKLRELVRDMWFGLYCPTEPGEGCSQCSFNKNGECFFEQRMCELGVEAE